MPAPHGLADELALCAALAARLAAEGWDPEEALACACAPSATPDFFEVLDATHEPALCLCAACSPARSALAAARMARAAADIRRALPPPGRPLPPAAARLLAELRAPAPAHLLRRLAASLRRGAPPAAPGLAACLRAANRLPGVCLAAFPHPVAAPPPAAPPGFPGLLLFRGPEANRFARRLSRAARPRGLRLSFEPPAPAAVAALRVRHQAFALRLHWEGEAGDLLPAFLGAFEEARKKCAAASPRPPARPGRSQRRPPAAAGRGAPAR